MHRFRQPEPVEEELNRLIPRLGRLHVRQRLGIEHDHAVDIFGHGRWIHPENWFSAHRVASWLMHMMGLAQVGKRHARRFRCHQRDIVLERLPLACDGLRLLHLTDLHLDVADDLVESLINALQGIDADIAVLTGDYRIRTYGPIDRAMQAMQELRPHLPERVYAVLGNHDCLAMVPYLERMNIHVLLNEEAEVESGLFLAGVDDPHYYRVDNLAKALEHVPRDAPVILLSHSPEIYRLAAHADIDLMLCGHTHGGQVCLPGGIAVVYDCECPRRYCRGAWSHGLLQGYTSSGCGTSILDVRFFCPPEIVVHRLRCSSSSSAMTRAEDRP